MNKSPDTIHAHQVAQNHSQPANHRCTIFTVKILLKGSTQAVEAIPVRAPQDVDVLAVQDL